MVIIIYLLYFICGALSFLLGRLYSFHRSQNKNFNCPVIPLQPDKTTSSANIPTIVTAPTPNRIQLRALTFLEDEDSLRKEKKVILPHEDERESHAPILKSIFAKYHHAASPLSTEILLQLHSDSVNITTLEYYNDAVPLEKALELYNQCSTIYLSRTGSLYNMPNKCLAISIIDKSHSDPIPHMIRRGLIAGKVDQFAEDYMREGALQTEKSLLPMLHEFLDTIIKGIREVVSGPDAEPSSLSNQSVILMVLNEGVLDLFMNFLCSCRAAGILPTISQHLLVIVGQEHLTPVLQSLGVKVYFSPHLGVVPAHAAESYGDTTFGLLMWLKASALFAVYRAGYDVLFQDVDMVWMADPLPILQSIPGDVLFMDDGASFFNIICCIRTPRFSPYFVNSGFYFIRHSESSTYLMEHMARSVSQIAMTHSHQSTLTKTVHEVADLHSLQWVILSTDEFPSGYLFHHDREYIERMKRHELRPAVFHMCWTSSRTEKVTYLKEMGLWLLPEANQTAADMSTGLINAGSGVSSSEYCLDPKHYESLSSSTTSRPDQEPVILSTCCRESRYWKDRHELEQNTV